MCSIFFEFNVGVILGFVFMEELVDRVDFRKFWLKYEFYFVGFIFKLFKWFNFFRFLCRLEILMGYFIGKLINWVDFREFWVLLKFYKIKIWY